MGKDYEPFMQAEGRVASGHEFVQATAQATYCRRSDCRKHYSEPVHHRHGFVCPSGAPCAVCRAEVPQ